MRLLDASIYNVIIGNADAHGKNFSLLHGPGGVTLAPLYDLMCTAAYTELSANFAIRITKRANLRDSKPDTWEAFAKDIGVGAPYVRRRARELAAAMSRRVPTVADDISALEFDGAALKGFVEITQERAALFLWS